MGTDRDEIENEPCPCGKGRIRVDNCSPDHPWGGGSWHEAYLDCAICRKTLYVEQFEGQLKLVRKSDLDKKEQLTQRWHKKRREIEASPEFARVRSALDQTLSACPSMAARHRLLSNAGLTHKSLASFRRNPGFKLVAGDALKAAEALGIKSPQLARMEEDLEQCWREANVELPAVPTGLRHLAA